MRISNTITSTAALCALCACGGTTSETMGDARFPTFLDAELARIEIAETFTFPTDDDNVPISGNAQYAGIMTVGLREEDGRAAGSVSIDVIFAGTGDISGSATDFVREDDKQLEGTLTLSEGSIDRFIAVNPNTRVTGTLTPAGEESVTLDVMIDGLFELPDASGISMSGNGTLAGPDPADGTVPTFAGIAAIKVPSD